jgi:cytochrome c oxidase subunit 2
MTPTRTGTFDVLCAELCGTGHAYMRGTVVTAEEADYQTWLQEQQTFSQFLAQLETGREHARVAD